MLDYGKLVEITNAPCPICEVPIGIRCKDVLGDDVLEDQLHMARIHLVYMAAVNDGCCSSCKRPVEAWTAPKGKNSVHSYKALRESGVDPLTGHSLDCPNNT